MAFGSGGSTRSSSFRELVPSLAKDLAGVVLDRAPADESRTDLGVGDVRAGVAGSDARWMGDTGAGERLVGVAHLVMNR